MTLGIFFFFFLRDGGGFVGRSAKIASTTHEMLENECLVLITYASSEDSSAVCAYAQIRLIHC